jgi:phosphoglycolate phosphatase
MNKETVLVFDFDGTIVQSFTSVVGIVNRLAAKFRLQPLAQEEVHRFRIGKSGHFLLGQAINKLMMPMMVKSIIREQAKEAARVKEVPGLVRVLKRLKKQGFRMGIISSNSETNIRVFLQARKLESLFEFVYSAQDLFGKEKVIAKMLTEQRLEKEQVVYIGDETRDVEAAHKAGVRAAAVCWGFQTKTAFQAYQPDWVIAKPNDLYRMMAAAPWWKQAWVRWKPVKRS